MNKTLVLAAVLFALIAVYWAMTSKEPIAKTNIPLLAADSASVTELEIITATDTTDLKKEGDGWKLMGAKVYPANPANVGRALQRFSQMTKKAMVTDKPERYGEFDVDSDKGVLVNITTNGKHESVFLGKAGPTMQTSYARLEGSDEVWEIGGNHTSAFRRPPADWRDKTITALAMDSISHVTIRHDGETLDLQKQDTLWKASENGVEFPAVKQQVERITRMLSRINAVEFADSLSDETFTNPKATVHAEMMDGSTVDLAFVPRDDKQYYVRKKGALSDFVLYNSTVEVFFKKKDELLDKEKPAG
ncbi:MAG: DUF4340 domain-containing protein [Calditrichaeota bacterium]|nr:DUF4340 domain-containing protein [Calditrichota bacterium]MCB9367904.1 DUF4340 domain-containing protein [Calditrichota bacterium]